MIKIDNISKQFAAPRSGTPFARGKPQHIQAVNQVSLVANNGSITGLLGPNGAGKTTTLRMLAGLIAPDAGDLYVDHLNVRREPLQALARMGILGDAHGLYPRLSARENVVYFGQLQGMNRDTANARTNELSKLLDMDQFLDRRAEGFSQGERMKTALARAMVHDPMNIVLDEPTNGLDVLATRALREVLRYLSSPAGGAKCIVFSTHIMPEVQQLCEQVVIMAQGRTVAHGSVDELMAASGQHNFEDAFVKLAFEPNAPRNPQ